MDTLDFLKNASNWLLVPGVLIAGVGALAWMSQKGAYDSLSYVTHVIKRKFQPKERVEKYYDYVLQRAEQREEKAKTGGTRWYKILTFVGFALIVLAAAFAFAYSVVES